MTVTTVLAFVYFHLGGGLAAVAADPAVRVVSARRPVVFWRQPVEDRRRRLVSAGHCRNDLRGDDDLAVGPAAASPSSARAGRCRSPRLIENLKPDSPVRVPGTADLYDGARRQRARGPLAQHEAQQDPARAQCADDGTHRRRAAAARGRAAADRPSEPEFPYRDDPLRLFGRARHPARPGVVPSRRLSLQPDGDLVFCRPRKDRRQGPHPG